MIRQSARGGGVQAKGACRRPTRGGRAMIGITSRHAGGRHFGAIACVCMALLLAFSFAAPFARSAEAKELKKVPSQST